MSQTVEYVENDTLPDLECTYEDVVVTDFDALELHIDYKPLPLVIDAVLDTPTTDFYFPFLGRNEGTLAAAASVGATQLAVVAGDEFTAMPSTGELLIDDEHVRYTSKVVQGTLLILETALVSAHSSGAAWEKLPDLRAGTWKAEVQTTNADGDRLTFPELTLKVAKEIA